MNIHEYQAKSLLKPYGLRVPAGGVAFSAGEAAAIAGRLEGPEFVVKAQVHAGGRGRAGGVRVVRSAQEVEIAAGELLGSTLVTEQTGAAGKVVRQVYVEQRCDVAQELYLAALVDRSEGRVALLASAHGGDAIEQTAETTPDSLSQIVIDPTVGLEPARVDGLVAALGLSGAPAEGAAATIKGVYEAFVDCDASLIEINPLAVTRTGEIVALDIKMSLDDNALMRHPELEALRDEDEVDPTELEAKRYELNYLKLDGDIGCMVNGAGLALATHDLIVENAGTPADFMDVRPEATREQVATGFRMLAANPRVRAILVNIYGGGILRCDTVAEGIADAVRAQPVTVPLVVRAAGTNAELCKKILSDRGIAAVFADDMTSASEAVVRAARGEAR